LLILIRLTWAARRSVKDGAGSARSVRGAREEQGYARPPVMAIEFARVAARRGSEVA
jgi:hypothetical protein